MEKYLWINYASIYINLQVKSHELILFEFYVFEGTHMIRVLLKYYIVNGKLASYNLLVGQLAICYRTICNNLFNWSILL